MSANSSLAKTSGYGALWNARSNSSSWYPVKVVRVFFFLPFACWPETDEVVALGPAPDVVSDVDAPVGDEVEEDVDECDLLLMDPAW